MKKLGRTGRTLWLKITMPISPIFNLHENWFSPEYLGLTRPKVHWFCFLSWRDEEGQGRCILHVGKDENLKKTKNAYA